MVPGGLLVKCVGDSPEGVVHGFTKINPEAVKWGDDHYDCTLCPGLQPGPPSQTPGGLGQRYWSMSEVTWPPKLELRRWRSSGPSSLMGPTRGPSGANRTQVGPMLAPWTLLSGCRLHYMGLGPCNWSVRGSANGFEKLSYITRLTEQIQPWISYPCKQWKNTHKTEYTEVFHTNEHDYESHCKSQRGTCNILQAPKKVIWLSDIYTTYDAACSTDMYRQIQHVDRKMRWSS